MKTAYIQILSIVLLAGCAGQAGNDHGDTMKAKRLERDSLKNVYAEVGVKIKEIEAWIAANDTTVKRNLPTVTATPVVRDTFHHYVDVHGNVRADKAAALSLPGGGRIRKVLVKPGDRVSAGQILISVDNDLVVKQMAQAEAALDLARVTFEKQSRLWEQKIGSEMQYLQARTQLEQAEAGMAALQEQQRLSNVTAPFAGIVDDVMVRVGDLAGPGMPVARVVDLSAVQLEADVPESYVLTVKDEAPVKVHFPSIGATFEGELDHVGKFIDPANRTFKVTVRVPEAQEYMRPNLLSDISIRDMSIDSALIVPSRTVMQDVNGNHYIYVLDGSGEGEARARKVMVERMSEYKGRISIKPRENGALEGDVMIVDEGARNVTDGLLVRVANS